MFDFRIYPSIANADDGAREMSVRLILMDPYEGRPTSLRVDVGDESWVVPISESDEVMTGHASCRVVQSIVLQNQGSLVQKIAAAARADLALVGYRQPVHYTMTGEDLTNFKRIAALWSAPILLPMPPKPASDGQSGAMYSGVNGITNPELIRSTKVQPKFPKYAIGKKVLGRVTLQAVVRKDGTVGDVVVKQGAGGDCGFEEAAIAAVSQWRYKPAMQNGRPVDVYFTVVIDFTFGDYKLAPGGP
jgi:protein TonB